MKTIDIWALWDVEAADAESVGCAEHRDPACLCDVDLSKTAHIEYNHCPPELTDVETVEDLTIRAAVMLARHRLHVNKVNVLNELAQRRKKDEAIFGALLENPRFIELAEYVLAFPDASAEQLYQALKTDQDSTYLNRQLRVLRQLLGVANNFPSWWEKAAELAKRGGYNVITLREALERMGYSNLANDKVREVVERKYKIKLEPVRKRKAA